jgi:hypothetical protein
MLINYSKKFDYDKYNYDETFGENKYLLLFLFFEIHPIIKNYLRRNTGEYLNFNFSLKIYLAFQ